jgi:DNA (cytosine-5)-methyltransferase 1
MNVAGLFAGIGGIELGLQMAGHHAHLFCESYAPARAVLERQFPDTKIISDIRKLEALPRTTKVNLLTAGFPCQDLSQAGATRGLNGAHSSLVRNVFRVLRRTRSEWVLFENVPFMLWLGNGAAMKYLTSNLERLGYRWAYRLVDSQAFGVPQRRKRVYLLASLNHDPRGVLLADDAKPVMREAKIGKLAHGFYWTEGNNGVGWAVDAIPTLKGGSGHGIPSPPGILLPDGRVVTPDIRDAERFQGFDAGWTAPADELAGSRGARWRMVGNAVTVPVAKWIGERLSHPGKYDGDGDTALNPRTGWPKAAWHDGNRRGISHVGPWPISCKQPPLHSFLKHGGKPLSERATKGFLFRAKRSNLRFVDGFLEALENHARSVARAPIASRGIRA